MGLFDYVDFEMDCPHCNGKATNFQTKSGSCTLINVSPDSALHFYGGCDKCGSWIDCEYIPPVGVGKIIATSSLYKKSPDGGATLDPNSAKTMEFVWDPKGKKNAD